MESLLRALSAEKKTCNLPKFFEIPEATDETGSEVALSQQAVACVAVSAGVAVDFAVSAGAGAPEQEDLNASASASVESDCAPPVDLAYQERHAALVRRGLRYVNSPSGSLQPLSDVGQEAGFLRHGTPVVVLAKSGFSSKVKYAGQEAGVWVHTSFLVTEAPARFVTLRAAPAAVRPPAAKANPAAPGELAIRRLRPAVGFDEVEVDPQLLPEDAPPGHIAHAKVRTNTTHTNPLVSFRFHDMSFQTTFTAAGSRRAAEVIARACWLKFEQGRTKEEVLRFRAECYARVNSPTAGMASPPAAKRPKVESSPAAGAEEKQVAVGSAAALAPASLEPPPTISVASVA